MVVCVFLGFSWFGLRYFWFGGYGVLVGVLGLFCFSSWALQWFVSRAVAACVVCVGFGLGLVVAWCF